MRPSSAAPRGRQRAAGQGPSAVRAVRPQSAAAPPSPSPSTEARGKGHKTVLSRSGGAARPQSARMPVARERTPMPGARRQLSRSPHGRKRHAGAPKCRWCALDERDHVLEDPFAQGRVAPEQPEAVENEDDAIDVDEACLSMFGFRLTDSLTSGGGGGEEMKKLEDALLDTPTVGSQGRNQSLALTRPMSSTALRSGKKKAGGLARPHSSAPLRGTSAGPRYVSRLLVKVPRKQPTDVDALQGPPSAFSESGDVQLPPDERNEKNERNERNEKKKNDKPPPGRGYLATPAARRKWRKERANNPLNNDPRRSVVTNAMGRPVRTLEEQRRIEERSWAQPTWEKSDVFPSWLTYRNDFQEVFPRFASGGLSVHQILLVSFRKPGHLRSDTDLQHLSNWVKGHSAFSGISHSQCTDLCRRVTLEELPRGHVVFSQGDEGRNFHMIFEGQVDVLVNGTHVAKLQAGTGFGELALSKPGAVRSATIIVADDECKLATVRASDFRDVMNRAQSVLLQNTIKFLSSNVPSFAELSKQRLRRLASFLSKKSFDAGSAILTQGAPAGDIMFVLSGSCCVQKDVEVVNANRWPDGAQKWRTIQHRVIQPVVLRHFSPGDYFGEEKLLGHVTRQYTVLASSDVDVLVLENKDFAVALQGVTERVMQQNAALYLSVDSVRLDDRRRDRELRKVKGLVHEAYGDSYVSRKHVMAEEEVRYALSPFTKHRYNSLGHDLEEVQRKMLRQKLENSPAGWGAQTIDRKTLNTFTKHTNLVAATVRRAAVHKARQSSSPSSPPPSAPSPDPSPA